MSYRDFTLIIVLIGVGIIIFLALELYVIMMISGFLASYFGFSGLLWWICAFMMFIFINGLIGAVYNRRLM